ncbi:3-deoxy-7-phosphoheptulonate synthase class II [Streptomyces sp. SLBN-115]|uniref:3-deoxy-7-phosphoheptulonate synthase class II n=1 Tax=Streptomyces sp. SLBN-115 TaxID=2768453 RepID=UPI001151EE81|nr:3-deoxy-7-phosphoheptulonate synthase class II [Streptomyces sp. SLBN-115]TQJ37106.1 3-deoxy-D-arabinoheptulosonate-7-phosphate synthase [Streptomyces sp. SLBN-115]
MTAAVHGPAGACPPPDDPKAESWRSRPAAHQPDWPDPAALRAAVDALTARPPLVAARECDLLRERLAAVARGEAFLLQGGDCAETFDALTADQLDGKLRTLGRMATALTSATRLRVVTVGRIAGQYAKPRSSPTETRGALTLPAYRGDAVNDRRFTAEARTPDARRLTRVYDASAATLNYLRTRTAGRPDDPPGQLFTSHEALLLEYEDALTRFDARTAGRYATSAHMVWIGERTRRPDGAHVEFASRIRNPVGVKLGPGSTADEALALADRLDPRREPGRLTFIVRMGATAVRDVLPPLVEKVTAGGAPVVWVCDPMHGNTVQGPSGHKTRHFETIMDEVSGFFEVHRALGTHPGGVHLELTGAPVTECAGGTLAPVAATDVGLRYESACDPRLNHGQSVELAHRVAHLMTEPMTHR